MGTQEKITGLQMGAVLYVGTIGTAFLLMPSASTALAGNDMWLAPLAASLGGFVPVWAAVRLYRLYPGRNFLGAMEGAFGPVIGRVLGVLFLLFHLHISGATLRDYAEFMSGHFYEQTPLYILLGSMIFLCATAIRAGIETLGRCAQIFLPVVLLLLALNILLLIPQLDAREMLPVLANGPLPVVKASYVVSGWFCQFILISFLCPYLDRQARPMRVGFLSVSAASLTMLLINLTVLFVFGDTAAKFYYPFLMASRYISISDFIEHVEAMVMMSWVLGTFIRISLFYFSTVVSIAHLCRLKDYRLVTFPVGLLLILMGVWVAPSMQALTVFISTWGTYYITFGYVGAPLIVLAVGACRRRLADAKGRSA